MAWGCVMAARRKNRKSDDGMVGKALAYLATQQDFYAERRNAGGKKIGDDWVNFGKSGVLDISGYFTPPSGLAVYYELEAKSSTGKLRPSQEKRIQQLTRARVPFCVARTLDDVRNFTIELRARVAALGRVA